MGSETSCKNYFTNETFGYAESKNGGYYVRARLGSNIKISPAGSLTKSFENDVDAMRNDRNTILAGASVAVFVAIAGLISGGTLSVVITSVLATVGLSGITASSFLYCVNDFSSRAVDAVLMWRDMDNVN